MSPLPFVLSLPHASAELLPETRAALALTEEQVRRAVDLGSDEVFGRLPALALLRARYSRFVVDLNRTPGDRGPTGVVARIDYSDNPIFLPGSEPDPTAVERLVESIHRPFHQSLAAALSLPGVRGLIDCHSLDGVGPAGAPDPGRRRADVCLGNGGDASGDPVPERRPTCSRRVLLALKEALVRVGFSVALNDPYSGGHIVRHWGPRLMKRGLFAVQIELNKDLYADHLQSIVYPEQAAEVSVRVEAALRELAAGLPA